jgi:hypothetical protein
MKEKMAKISYWASVVIVGLAFGIILQAAKAWTEPTVAPPNGNVGAPINTGPITQTKAGDICTSAGGGKCLSAASTGGGGGPACILTGDTNGKGQGVYTVYGGQAHSSDGEPHQVWSYYGSYWGRSVVQLWCKP